MGLPSDIRANRLSLKVYCGRYGHQPKDMWENRPVTELKEFAKELQKLLEAETPETRMNENR